ncbi:hypothetical protein CEE37_05040 [candidate division LCP-89 bacterium B3_LCP]|uniref:IrrE N-terminal-like domain-containing protein n=1 Tax=candidate division LCP-89 bacterium B3_LCP TaxID=2012998 RepID=A0A532V1E2_UNCL8|nr:MAG: hypothetical protein CEE37_05040 [candidate division LCP-89 bacterium B3_LCP]
MGSSRPSSFSLKPSLSTAEIVERIGERRRRIPETRVSFLDDLAKQYNAPYRLTDVPDGRRSYLIGDVIVLDRSLRIERLHWAYCHELAHLQLQHHQCPPVDDTEERQQETDANNLAAELILPEIEFKPLVHETLLVLKQRFAHASHEVIARRRLNYRQGVLTIFDNDQLTARLSPDGWNHPAQLLPIESEVMQKCLESKSEVLINMGEYSLEATYVDEGQGVVRVLLFLESQL